MKKFGSWSEQVDTKFRTSGDNKIVTLDVPASLTGASLTHTLPDISGTSDTLVSLTSTATLTNKTLTSPVISTIVNTGTLTLPTSTDTLVGRATTDTLTNKTIDADTNTISNIDNGEIKANAGIEFSKMESLTSSRALVSDGLGEVSVSVTTATELSQLSGIVSAAVGVSDNQQLTNKTIIIDDDNLTIQDNLDATKQMNFQLSGLTTATTRTITVPDADDTMTVLAAAQTLTNKTIDSDNNTITNIADADIKAGAAITRSKLAAGTADHVIINDGTGVLSSEATLAITRGGTGQATATAGFDALAPTTTKGDLIVHDGTNNIRIVVGSDGQVLTADSAQASGLNWTSPLTNPMDSDGDLIVGGASGAATKLDHPGASGYVLAATGASTTAWTQDPEINSITVVDGVLNAINTTNDFTVPANYSMVNSNMTVSTGDTYTVASGAFLDVFDVITIVGTLDVSGTVTVR